jgi:glucokinase
MSPELLASVDLGGTTISVALGDPHGSVLNSASIPTEGNEGPARVLARLAALLNELTPPNMLLRAVGMGVPGLLDQSRRCTLFLPNLATQWRNVPVAETLEFAIGSPVYLLNDARLAALGELDFGLGRSVPDFVFFTLGTGIGGGVVLDGKLRLGAFGAAGELGHQTILPDGPLCGCGMRGCLEAVASAPALSAEGIRLLRSGQAPRLAALTQGDSNRVNPKTMAECGDPAIGAAIQTVARYLGAGLANVATILHPQAFVLGGGMAQLGDKLFGPAREEMIRRVRMFPVNDISVIPSQTGDNAALLGGFALAARAGRL